MKRSVLAACAVLVIFMAAERCPVSATPVAIEPQQTVHPLPVIVATGGNAMIQPVVAGPAGATPTVFLARLMLDCLVAPQVMLIHRVPDLSHLVLAAGQGNGYASVVNSLMKAIRFSVPPPSPRPVRQYYCALTLPETPGR